MPQRGKRTSGSREVAGIGIASVIHQIAIQIAEAAVKVTSGFPGWRSKNNRTNAKRAGPRNSPIRCLDQILLLPVGSFFDSHPGISRSFVN